MSEKMDWLNRLNAARDDLWRALDSIADEAELSPGRTKRDVYAHIAGWEAVVFEALRQHVYGTPATPIVYSGVDAFNARVLAERSGATIAGARTECEINRFAILTLLQSIPDADFDATVTFPWGTETILQLVHGAINHEHEHEQEARALKGKS